MRAIRLKNLRNESLLADPCYVAERFFDRLKGLMGRKALAEKEAVYFPKCNSIHMWWMAMSLDVVFLRELSKSEQAEFSTAGKAPLLKVTSLHHNVLAWKLIPIFDFKAQHTLEMKTGSILKSDLKLGDVLCSS
jgi:uncharacterized membrane protein (UPF0127 family)